jgi:AraC-like DNA-binding protein
VVGAARHQDDQFSVFLCHFALSPRLVDNGLRILYRAKGFGVLSSSPKVLTETPGALQEDEPMDVLSDVLQMVRLEGALFLNAELHEPWCVEVPKGSDVAQVLRPGAENLAICHMILEGRCWVQLPACDPVPVEAGDVVVLPHGDSHIVGSGLRHAPVNIDHLIQVKLPELNLIRYGGQGDQAVVVCGWFAYERDVPNPLVESLPRLFRSPVGQRSCGQWILQSIRYALTEAVSHQPGSSAVAAKVAESVFVEALRAYIDSLPSLQSGWLSGLRDPQISKCLDLLHSDPARNWSIEELAHEVHVSRSVLAKRFNELVGVPPMQYLKRWRLAIAARLLCNERSSLIRVTEAIGYESEASFSRAFRKEFGVPPGQWRKGAFPTKVASLGS